MNIYSAALAVILVSPAYLCAMKPHNPEKNPADTSRFECLKSSKGRGRKARANNWGRSSQPIAVPRAASSSLESSPASISSRTASTGTSPASIFSRTPSPHPHSQLNKRPIMPTSSGELRIKYSRAFLLSLKEKNTQMPPNTNKIPGITNQSH